MLDMLMCVELLEDKLCRMTDINSGVPGGRGPGLA
jgi:hypothetical protein